ncbi:hypothetical protein OHT52_21225 [Streptomyces sp. NBC_00247]|uniref:hypothetical protein n=1 Tax=Streptomyces sp. NBC_00247 TaxID=2975689 RepID=UPI002E2BEE41|nr:hypothetical protein [Streptomyces sp. NBC_00247]
MTNYRRLQRTCMTAAVALGLLALAALLTNHIGVFGVLIIVSVLAGEASDRAYRRHQLARTVCCPTWESSDRTVHGRHCTRRST